MTPSMGVVRDRGGDTSPKEHTCKGRGGGLEWSLAFFAVTGCCKNSVPQGDNEGALICCCLCQFVSESDALMLAIIDGVYVYVCVFMILVTGDSAVGPNPIANTEH